MLMFNRLFVALLLVSLALSVFAATREDLSEAILADDVAMVTRLLNVNPQWLTNADGNLQRTPLSEAAWSNASQVVNVLLARGAPADCTEEDGSTPLFGAIIYGNEKTAKTLIKHGADVNAVNKNGDTPLIEAARTGAEIIAAQLIIRGAKIEAANTDGMTPLLYATLNNHTNVATLLIENGANVNAAGSDEVTPLRYALLNANARLADALRKRGATVAKPGTLIAAIEQGKIEDVRRILRQWPDAVNKKDKGDWNPLHFAALFGRVDIAKVLLDAGAKLEETESFNYSTPLVVAVRANQPAVVTLLLDRGANINATDYDTMLGIAISNESLDMLNLLLKRGADPNATTCEEGSYTPLASASEAGSVPAIEALRTHGARVNEFSAGSCAPIYFAKNASIARLLIAHGGDVNAKSYYGEDDEYYYPTPVLHHAVERGDLELVRVLLDNGALINARGYNEVTPLKVALREKHPQVAELLRARGGVETVMVPNPLTVFLRNGANIVPLHYVAERLGFTVTNGAGKDDITLTAGQTTVKLTVGQVAAKKDGKAITLAAPVQRIGETVYVPAALFREVGVTVSYSATDKEITLTTGTKASLTLPCTGKETSQWTALDLDCYAGLTDRVAAQLKAGTPPDERDGENFPPLHWAAMRGRVDVIKLLLDAGADINLGDENNRRPLHWAAMKGRPETCTLLLARGAQLEARDCTGKAALHTAVANVRPTTVRLLVDKGADVNAVDYWNETVLDQLNYFAKGTKANRQTIIDTLTAHGATRNYPEEEVE